MRKAGNIMIALGVVVGVAFATGCGKDCEGVVENITKLTLPEGVSGDEKVEFKNDFMKRCEESLSKDEARCMKEAATVEDLKKCK